jgi:hypothetical protein
MYNPELYIYSNHWSRLTNEEEVIRNSEDLARRRRVNNNRHKRLSFRLTFKAKHFSHSKGQTRKEEFVWKEGCSTRKWRREFGTLSLRSWPSSLSQVRFVVSAGYTGLEV